MAAEGIPVEVDTTKAQAFAGRLLTALNDAALCLMVPVGHRTGLFDVMTYSPPATSEDLASRAGLSERFATPAKTKNDPQSEAQTAHRPLT